MVQVRLTQNMENSGRQITSHWSKIHIYYLRWKLLTQCWIWGGRWESYSRLSFQDLLALLYLQVRLAFLIHLLYLQVRLAFWSTHFSSAWSNLEKFLVHIFHFILRSDCPLSLKSSAHLKSLIFSLFRTFQTIAMHGCFHIGVCWKIINQNPLGFSLCSNILLWDSFISSIFIKGCCSNYDCQTRKIFLLSHLSFQWVFILAFLKIIMNKFIFHMRYIIVQQLFVFRW